jgi:hypothetical protein
MQSVDAPSSERFVTDGHLRPSGRIDARASAREVVLVDRLPPRLPNRRRDCSDPQTAVVVNHQDRPS